MDSMKEILFLRQILDPRMWKFTRKNSFLKRLSSTFSRLLSSCQNFTYFGCHCFHKLIKGNRPKMTLFKY